MAAKPAIEVRDVAKLYRKGENAGRTTLAEAVSSWGRSVLGRSVDRKNETFWALDGVSLDVQPGESVGLIGENGAGKSTLLKVLSRITPPTRGTVTYRGRVGSLLDVGTGFHPELSGRDNIFLSGAILGMSRADVRRRFDEIVAFSEVESFIDTPVKRYSSGMYMRLAFAVAAHLDTDIILVDEVLAVGDHKFQQKCLNRMDSIAHDGRTVIFVSHSMVAIQSICRRAVWLEKGQVAADGDSTDVIRRYTGGVTATDGLEKNWSGREGPGRQDFRLLHASIRRVGGGHNAPIDVHTPFTITFEYDNRRDRSEINFAVILTNADGVVVFNVGPDTPASATAPGRFRESWQVPGDLLNDGTYRISLEIRDRGELVLEAVDVLTFDVQDTPADRHGWYGKWDGAIRPRLQWSFSEITPEPAPQHRATAPVSSQVE